MVLGKGNKISIHAPAKGATRHGHMLFDKRIFQSTLPRRERQRQQIKGQKDMRNFNPRSREGSDCANSAYALSAANFNPRSREGSDRGAPYWLDAENHFNPRSREGSDEVWRTRTVTGTEFQSTLPRRERQHLLTSFRLQYGYSLFHLTNKI